MESVVHILRNRMHEMPFWAFRAFAFIGVGGVFATVLFGMPVYSRTTPVSITPTPTPSAPTSESHTVALPSRLRIPSLSIDAAIQNVGVGKNGNMAVPSGLSQYRDVAWYRGGIRPGEVGNAVIAGHLDGAFGLPAVFGDLALLIPGDPIEVVDHNGVTHHFIVAAKEEHNADRVPTERVFGPAKTPRLNLITCAGVWDKETSSYTKRLVVYAIEG